MQTVTNLYKYNSYVVAHGEQQLLEVLSLCRGFVAKDTATDFCQTVNDESYLFAKDILHVFNGVVGIFNNIV